MEKQNAYLLRQKAKRAREDERLRSFVFQQCADVAILALSQEPFHFGPERNKKFMERYQEAYLEYAKLCVDDAKDDSTITYTTAKIDDALKRSLGDYFVPWEERYGS